MSLLLSVEEICELDRVTNRYIDFGLTLSLVVLGPHKYCWRLLRCTQDPWLCHHYRSSHRPYFIIGKISKEIRLIPDCTGFTARERQAMQKYVDDLSGCLGSSERIVQTPGTALRDTTPMAIQCSNEIGEVENAEYLMRLRSRKLHPSLPAYTSMHTSLFTGAHVHLITARLH